MQAPIRSPEDLSAFLKNGQRQFVRKNTVIYRQGELGSGFYYVEKGLIKIYTCSPAGDELNLDFRGKGHIFGELALIGEPYISTAVAAEDSVLYFFSKERFKEMVKQHDVPLTLILNSLLAKLNILVETRLLTSAEQLIAHALLKLAETAGHNRITVKQTDLANFTGLTRITVNKTFQKWKKENIISVENKTIVIRDVNRLKSCLSAPENT